MAEMDTDGNATVEFDEFVDWWRRTAESRGRGVFGGLFSKISLGFLRSKSPGLSYPRVFCR